MPILYPACHDVPVLRAQPRQVFPGPTTKGVYHGRAPDRRQRAQRPARNGNRLRRLPGADFGGDCVPAHRQPTYGRARW